MANNILILLGSPRKNGNSATLSDQLRQGAEAKGATVETIYVNGLDIRPCQGCESCQRPEATGCVIEDEMQALYAKLGAATAIVIASPVYWFNFSAQIKTVIDRCYAVGVDTKNIFSGKHFAILITYADADPYHSGAGNVMRIFSDMCRYLKANIAGMAFGSADGPGDIRNNDAVMQRAHQLGERLAAI